MAALIQKIGRLAIKTFRREGQACQATFKTNYDHLCDLLGDLTCCDLSIEAGLLLDRGTFNASRDGAPVTYMQIYEDLDLTICVFILKRGVRLPLHDHPGMCGLLKVIHGIVSVQSYSLNTQDTTNTTNTTTVPPHPHLLTAHKHPHLTATASDKPCRLNPNANNLHEIHSIDGPAAFLDILSPPYGMDSRLGLERDCHYFREVPLEPRQTLHTPPQTPPQTPGPQVLLYRVETPNDFWCDQAEYKGPPIFPDTENGIGV